MGIELLLPAEAALFLPGYAWVLISGISRRMNLAEQVTLAFVISLALLSLLTAGLSLVTQEYLLFSLIFSVGGSLTALGLYILTRGFRRIRPSNLKSLPRLLLLCLVAYCILLAASFWSAPYYPTAETPDLINHTHLIQAVLAGDGRNVLLHGNTPVGLHFVSALMAYVLQLAPLESLRIVGALVLLAIVSMFYSSARRMFDSDAAGSIIMLIGSFVLPADLIHFIRAGTYPNLLEDCLILGLLWLLVSYVDQPSKTVGASMSLLTVAGVFAHSSSFLFLAAAVISVPFVYLVAPRASFRNYVRALLYCLTALVLFAAVLWPFFRGNLGRITGAYVELGQPLALSVLHVSYFVFVYDLGYLLGWVNVALLFASVLVALFMSKKSVWSVLLLVWLGVQFVSPVFSEQGFRFVLLGMVPGSFIIGKGLADFGAWGKLGSTRWNNVKPRLLPILLIVLILSGSLPGLIPKIINPYQRARQEAVYDSMQWLSQQGVCQNVASSGLPSDYLYLSALTRVNYAGDFLQPADAMLAKSRELGFTCIAVSTANPYFNSFEASPSYRELYYNNIVWIFAVSH